MAPALVRTIRRLTASSTRAVETFLGTDTAAVDSSHLQLSKRAGDPSEGVLDPHDIKNAGFFFLFAVIGVAFIATGIWFFFWAKNGGFHFKKNDWDDYKSTVLRRKGPNGTLLSGATPSTNLGGGSVYKHYDDDDGTTTVTESTALSGITAGASDIFSREKRKKKQEKRDAERQKRRGEKVKKPSTTYEHPGVLDENAEKEAKKHLRSYRHERPARVGGLNKESEGSNWDGSTNPTESSVGTSSDLLSNRQSTPTTTPTKAAAKGSGNGGIRKVYSTADRNANRESERMRAEARRSRQEDRVARRDFSFQRAEGGITSSQLSESLLSGSGSGGSTTVGESSVGGSTIDGTGSDLGTKSYHHPMPELREQRKREREERRARRSKSGYRRGNNEDSEL